MGLDGRKCPSCGEAAEKGHRCELVRTSIDRKVPRRSKSMDLDPPPGEWVIEPPGGLYGAADEKTVKSDGSDPRLDLPLPAPPRDTPMPGAMRAVAALPELARDARVGTLLGQEYRVVECLGAGGMGTVYVVEHVHLKKQFAAKVLNPEMARKPDAVARFELEAISASRLDHDNIVNVVNFGRADDGTVYLVMELLRGQTLDQRLRRGPVSDEEVVGILVPVCRALAAAHGAGIVHRDMKPENVFLARRSDRLTVKVLDFGVSKIKETKLAEAKLTQTGQVLGSPLYMSPEASRGAGDVDARADVYAAGVMLYEMLCGEPPFQADNYLQVLYMHINQEPRPPRELKPDLRPEIQRVVLKALEKDRAKRYQSMDELANDLLATFPHVDPNAPLALDLAGAGGPMGMRTPTPLRSTPHRTGTAQTKLPPARRKRRGTVILATATAVILCAVGLVAWQRYGGDGAGKGSSAAAPPAPAPAPKPAPTPAPSAVPDAGSAVRLPPVPPPANADEVLLTVDSTPSGATVYLDDVELGETPLRKRVARGGMERTVRLERAGYKIETRTVVLDEDVAVPIALRRASGKPKPPRPTDPLEIKEGR